MAEAAGLALGVAALFDTCIDAFKIVFAAQDFAKDFEVLNASFQQQRLRFLLWGEGVGLVSRHTSNARPYLQELDGDHVRPTILKSLGSIQYLLQQFRVYESRYGLKNDPTLSLINVSGSKAVEDRFIVLAKRNQKQKSVKAVTRWAVFDAEKMKETIERLKGLVDGLADITDQLRRLQSKANSSGGGSSIQFIEARDIRAVGQHYSTLSVCSRQIEALDLQGSIDTFFTAQSFLPRPSQGSMGNGGHLNRISLVTASGSTPDQMVTRDSHDSISTYASTEKASDVSDLESSTLPWPTGAIQSTNSLKSSPWSAADIAPSNPSEFAVLFPSRTPLFIFHDHTTPDGSMNLRVFTSATPNHHEEATYKSLFHLRMHDLRQRDFSFRRYHRSSGREICHSALKFVKSTKIKRSKTKISFSSFGKRRSSAASASSENENRDGESDGWRSNSRGSRTSVSSWFRRRGSRSSRVSDASGSEAGDLDGDEDSVDVAATRLPTNTIRLEFSNYAQVDVARRGTRSRKRYIFEYWGKKYTWKRKATKSDSDVSDCWSHSFYLFSEGQKDPVAFIKPEEDFTPLENLISENEIWVPPCEMQILNKEVFESVIDVSDIVVATGVVSLVDNAIRFYSSNIAKQRSTSATLSPRQFLQGPYVTLPHFDDHAQRRVDDPLMAKFKSVFPRLSKV